MKAAPYKQRKVGDTMRAAHALIVEAVLGRPLPKGAEVHHVDGNGHNNAHSNLVVCPDRAYHMHLHQRQRALDACGNAGWVLCIFCKQHDAPENMTKIATRNRFYHIPCRPSRAMPR